MKERNKRKWDEIIKPLKILAAGRIANTRYSSHARKMKSTKKTVNYALYVYKKKR